jgi:hypothetical protein
VHNRQIRERRTHTNVTPPRVNSATASTPTWLWVSAPCSLNSAVLRGCAEMYCCDVDNGSSDNSAEAAVTAAAVSKLAPGGAAGSASTAAPGACARGVTARCAAAAAAHAVRGCAPVPRSHALGLVLRVVARIFPDP